MRRLMDVKVWSGPLGVARIVGILSALWLLVVGFAGVVGLAGYSPGKIVLPMGLMLLSLGFLAGYQLGQAKQ